MKPGKLYGVSVGPGDPALMTLKAAECIRCCPVLAAPRMASGKTLALDIAAAAVDISGKQIEYLSLPMTRDADALLASRQQAAGQIAAHLEHGEDVALLNLGDASLYSSYSYLCRLLCTQGYAAETIPGVPSFCACAAQLNRSLAETDQPLQILPAAMPNLAAALLQPGGKVVMKAGSSLAGLKQLLQELGLTEHAVLITDCGLPSQQIYQDLQQAPDTAGYFSTLLLR